MIYFRTLSWGFHFVYGFTIPIRVKRGDIAIDREKRGEEKAKPNGNYRVYFDDDRFNKS